jgi:hypothetical protein
MRDHDYNRAEDEDRQHFIQCHVCGQWIDARDMDEVLLHGSVEHEADKPADEAPISKRPVT